jgi:hypothetical protein
MIYLRFLFEDIQRVRKLGAGMDPWVEHSQLSFGHTRVSSLWVPVEVQ